MNKEIKRGTVDKVKKVNQNQIFSKLYFAKTGQSQYQKNRQASRRPIKVNTCMEFVTYAIDKIKHDKWSPDAVFWICETSWTGMSTLVCQQFSGR